MSRPRLLFVCVKNGGKSQMAAALARQIGGDAVVVTSAGTSPGTSLNQLAVESLAEVGASMAGEHPKLLTPEMMRDATHIIQLGTEAEIPPVDGVSAEVRTWEIDEPSARGIEGAERMRLVREDIAAKVIALILE